MMLVSSLRRLAASKACRYGMRPLIQCNPYMVHIMHHDVYHVRVRACMRAHLERLFPPNAFDFREISMYRVVCVSMRVSTLQVHQGVCAM